MSFRKMSLRSVSAIGVISTLAFASTAYAANPKEIEIIVIDGSGTMTMASKASPASSTATVSKWDESFNQIEAKLMEQKLGTEKDSFQNNLPVKNHAIAVWVFANNWVKQVYPLPAGTEPFVVDPATYSISQLAEMTDADHTNDPFTLTGYDTAKDQIRTTVQNKAGIRPANGGPLTPLADGLCQALKAARVVATNLGSTTTTKHVVLFSDGLENNSQGECTGITSAFDPSAQFTSNGITYFSWAGGATDTSWQYKTFNMAVFNQVTPLLRDATVTVNRPITTDFTTFLLQILPGPLTPAANNSRLNRVNVDAYALYDYVQGQANNIPTALQKFYDDLSTKSGGQSVHVVYGSGYPVPTVESVSPNCTGRVLGDVDCSGIVDDADYYQVTQKDIWGQRVLIGWNNATNSANFHELRNKADFNRDGIVNDWDLEFVFNNWGMTW